jgi:hypothetical protein
MKKHGFDAIKKKLNDMAAAGWEPELELIIQGKTYMIIAYEDHCSFQRCGIKDRSGEINYQTLDELYQSPTVDDILLERDWRYIEEMTFLQE